MKEWIAVVDDYNDGDYNQFLEMCNFFKFKNNRFTREELDKKYKPIFDYCVFIKYNKDPKVMWQDYKDALLLKEII